jgi:hypothetical protein
MEDGNHNIENNATSVLTADEFLKIGLQLVGYKKRRIRRAKKRSHVERFLGHYGSICFICAMVWEDLQTTEVYEARNSCGTLESRVLSDVNAHHLKRYPTEVERVGIFDISSNWDDIRSGTTWKRYKPSRHRRWFGQMTILETIFGF